MLTCDEVRERLPGIATGETAAPEVREHLASCDACRTERGKHVAEVERIREGLASLAPSPFLEDAVLEAAAEAAAETPRRRRPWAYVGAAALATAALFLVVILPRLGPGGPAGDENEHADEERTRMARVGFPPSAAEVDAARLRNDKSVGGFALPVEPGKRLYLHNGTDVSGVDIGSADVFLAARRGCRHRYVVDARAPAGERIHDVTSWPPERGLLMLGLGMIEEIGGVLAPSGETAIHLGAREWRTTVGTSQGEITLGSPDANGAKARVRVHVSPGYTGTLLIEGPLARALGLHQFEIPGGVGFASPEGGTIPVYGQRARARVAIPELDFEKIVEVQVVPERPWMVKRASDGQERGIRIQGEAPNRVLYAHEVELLDEAADAMALGDVQILQDRGEITEFDPGDGTWRVVLSYSGEPPGDVPLPRIPDEPELGTLFWHEEANLVLPPIDFTPPYLRGVRLDVTRVTVQGKWPPGASVVVARVWRGTTAIPSAEAVSWTRVKADGTLSFLRITGEPGSGLRMRVIPEEGDATFHEVVVAPDLLPIPRVEVRVHADGRVEVGEDHDSAIDLLHGEWAGDDVSERPRAEYSEALASLLRAHGIGQAPRMGRDQSRYDRSVELSLRVDADAPWRLVQWVLEARAHPKLRESDFSLALAHAPTGSVTYRHPPRGYGTVKNRLPHYEVRLGRSTRGAPLRGQLLDTDRGVDLAPYFEKERPWTAIASYMVAMHGLGPESRLTVVEVPPPGLVTFAEVFEVLDALDEAKLTNVLLGWAPHPR